MTILEYRRPRGLFVIPKVGKERLLVCQDNLHILKKAIRDNLKGTINILLHDAALHGREITPDLYNDTLAIIKGAYYIQPDSLEQEVLGELQRELAEQYA